jgi:hypothetical protein
LIGSTAAPGIRHRITLLTDFGTADGYVAAMKGVIASIAPSVIIDDASHDLPAGDVHAASWALATYWHLYPPGTVHVAVVDPGVGSSRRALAIEVAQRIIIAPDNGIVTGVLRQSPLSRTIEISNPALMRGVISATFHGRDVFAPAAAHVAAGMPLHELGPTGPDPFLLSATQPARDGAAISGTVTHVDHFGNLITDIPGDAVAGGYVTVQGRMRVPVARTYSDVAVGEGVALIGSRGYLEVSVRGGSAAEMTAAGRGASVVWSPGPGTRYSKRPR